MICDVERGQSEEVRNRGGRMRRPCKWKVMLQKNEYSISGEVASDGTVVVAAMGMVDAYFSSPTLTFNAMNRSCQRIYMYICSVVHVLRLRLETHPITIKFCPNPISVSLRRLCIPKMLAAFLFLISRSDLLRPKLIFPPVERRPARIEINLKHPR